MWACWLSFLELSVVSDWFPAILSLIFFCSKPLKLLMIKLQLETFFDSELKYRKITFHTLLNSSLFILNFDFSVVLRVILTEWGMFQSKIWRTNVFTIVTFLTMQKFIRLRQTQNWCFKMKIKCGRKGVEKGHKFFFTIEVLRFRDRMQNCKKKLFVRNSPKLIVVSLLDLKMINC